MLLLPVESAFFPFIDKADGQNAEERYHRPEAEQADIAERYSPWKQEGDFEVENDEQQRHEIKPHVEFITGIAERVEAAFISGIFIGGQVFDARRESSRGPSPRTCRGRLS